MIANRNFGLGKQRGVTLIEVLVTLLLISVGLLGVAALQLTSLRANKDAYVRAQAVTLAADILDRMRANTAAFRSGKYDTAWNGTGTSGTVPGTDLAAWQTSIDTLLPGGATTAAGSISRSGNIATISIRWSERTDSATVRAGGTSTDTPIFTTRSEI
jgi:type IV pilus assembly protein PilV